MLISIIRISHLSNLYFFPPESQMLYLNPEPLEKDYQVQAVHLFWSGPEHLIPGLLVDYYFSSKYTNTKFSSHFKHWNILQSYFYV